MSHVSVFEAFKKVAKNIGVPKATFHHLRHSYAVLYLTNGDDIKTLQEALGHYSAAFTLDTYGHVTEKMKNESAQRIQEAYSNMIEKL